MYSSHYYTIPNLVVSMLEYPAIRTKVTYAHSYISLVTSHLYPIRINKASFRRTDTSTCESSFMIT